MNWRSISGALALVGLMCALGLSGGCSDASKIAAALPVTATGCVHINSAFEDITVNRVNQNSTEVSPQCDVKQGMNVVPPVPTIVMPANMPMQVIRP